MASSKRILVSAGDPSGDLILASLVRAMREGAPNTSFEFVGLCGPASEAEGVKPLASAKDVAVVGISEVLRNIRKIFGTLDLLRAELPRVDSLLCLDFPDFNLRLAAMARNQKVPTDYIIAPQVWAWRHGRLPQISRCVRRMYPVLPFEEELFRNAGIDARFLGHPIRDMLPPRARREARKEFDLKPEDYCLAILPGSRSTEIRRHLPLFLDAWDELERFEKRRGFEPPRHALLPMAPGWDELSIEALLSDKDRARLRHRITYGWRFVRDSRRALMAADFGWIVSGTASLEAALYMLPHVLVYRLSRLSAFLIRASSQYFRPGEGFAGLPNILLGRETIPELLQDQLDPKRLALETFELRHDNTRLTELNRSLRYLPKKLGNPGAITRMAEDLLHLWGAR